MATTKKTATLGKKVSAFHGEMTSEQKFKLSNYKGKKLVIYFYPRDSTPGCTTEGLEFRDSLKKFKRANTEVFGVSKDSMKSHEKFKEKQGFNFELISDEDGEICELFDVMKMKNMYGKKFLGIERSTFIIDESGKLVKEWRKVKVKGHVDEVLSFVKAL